MKTLKLFSFLAPVAGILVLDVPDASACGGCFAPPTENTQVTSHRMILSVSPTQTTLWDQITYSGAPESFAWVLPTKGVVDIGLSSDALFETLDLSTQVQVTGPIFTCPNSCNSDGAAGFGAGAGTGGGEGVDVIAQEVVGPYETVQLSASDPAALKTWLAEHGYGLPPDVAPVIDAYVGEGFNFLALKLVPGQGVDSMRPVRVTTPGASPGLPLRMVAAGTGATTPITLWVLGEGRYGPSNFPSFTIGEEEVTWNLQTSSSDYRDIRQAGFDATNGKSWLIEDAEPYSRYAVEDQLSWLVDYDPTSSGYGDAEGTGAPEELQADLDALFGGINASSLWVTRMLAELSRPALSTDLKVGASPDQIPVNRFLNVTKTTGEPACPPDPCGGAASGGDSSGGPGSSGDPWIWEGGSTNDDFGKGGGCAIGGVSTIPATLAGLGVVMALAALRRRRRR